MPTILLDGTLTAVTPIAIILPASADQRTPAKAPTKRLIREGQMVETVYVPPSSLRGRLRHLLTQELMRLRHENDRSLFTPDDYIDTALGGVKDRKAAGDDDREIDLRRIREIRERNPIVSLFGSMVGHVSGRLMVGDLTPLEPVAPVRTGRSVRANPFARNPAIIELLDPKKFDEFIQLNALRTAANRVKHEAEKLKRQIAERKRSGAPANEVQELETQMKALQAEAKRKFEQAGGAVNIQQPLDGYDTIPEGTVMSNRIRLVAGTDTEAALLILALDLLARRPLIGGHTAHGCGEIAGAWKVRMPEGNAAPVVGNGDGAPVVGCLRIEPFVGLAVKTDHPPLRKLEQRARGIADDVAQYDFRVA
jgi:hypothetical protein